MDRNPDARDGPDTGQVAKGGLERHLLLAAQDIQGDLLAGTRPSIHVAQLSVVFTALPSMAVMMSLHFTPPSPRARLSQFGDEQSDIDLEVPPPLQVGRDVLGRDAEEDSGTPGVERPP